MCNKDDKAWSGPLRWQIAPLTQPGVIAGWFHLAVVPPGHHMHPGEGCRQDLPGQRPSWQPQSWAGAQWHGCQQDIGSTQPPQARKVKGPAPCMPAALVAGCECPKADSCSTGDTLCQIQTQRKAQVQSFDSWQPEHQGAPACSTWLQDLRGSASLQSRTLTWGEPRSSWVLTENEGKLPLPYPLNPDP